MRSILALVAALLLVAAGCSSGSDTSTETVQEPTAIEDPTPDTPEPTATVAPTPTSTPTAPATSAADQTGEATVEPESAAQTGETGDAGDPTDSDEADTETTAFDYLDGGEFDVGVATVTIDEDTDRPLTVDVWFPLTDDVAGPPHQYTFLPGIYYESPAAVTAELSAIASGTFPLVVYSHGSGGQRYIHANYTEFIASHGYVVVAPDHTGNTLLERFSGTDVDIGTVALQRPIDITNLLDATLDATTELGSSLAESLTDDVIVTGHSFGGFTAYATVAGFETDAGTYEPDRRVDAIIPLAPAASEILLSDDRLMAVDVPHLVMVGDSDDTTPATPNVDRPVELVTGSPNYRVDLVAGEHETFTDLCDYVEFLPALATVPDFIVTTLEDFSASACSNTAMPLERAQEITNSFAVRFLDEVTAGGPTLGANVDASFGDDVIFQSND